LAPLCTIKWYSDPTLSTLIHSGNEFEPERAKTDTFYVSQTLNGVQSWPKEVIIHVVQLPETNLVLKNDTLSAPWGDQFYYQWLYRGDSINAYNNYVLVDTTGNYENFSVIISEGVCRTVIDGIDIITSIESETSAYISYYPNPTTTKGYVTINGAGQRDVTFQMFNMQGSEVFRKKSNFHADDEAVDMTHLAAGLYLLRVIGENFQETIRVIKE